MVETTDFLPGGGMVNIGNATEPWKEIHAEQMYVNGNLVTPNEDGEHVPTSRKINNKPLSDDITLTAGDVGAAASSHTHDDRYYTENEIDTKLGGKANSSHGNHVPTTESANNARFLRNDNTWQTVTAGNIGAAPSSHSHNYAGSSSAGGAATSANKLNTNAGNANTPVYFSNGVPVACGDISAGAYSMPVTRVLNGGGNCLFSKSGGMQGNITLSQAFTNFKYLVIFCGYSTTAQTFFANIIETKALDAAMSPPSDSKYWVGNTYNSASGGVIPLLIDGPGGVFVEIFTRKGGSSNTYFKWYSGSAFIYSIWGIN